MISLLHKVIYSDAGLFEKDQMNICNLSWFIKVLNILHYHLNIWNIDLIKNIVWLSK